MDRLTTQYRNYSKN